MRHARGSAQISLFARPKPSPTHTSSTSRLRRRPANHRRIPGVGRHYAGRPVRKVGVFLHGGRISWGRDWHTTIRARRGFLTVCPTTAFRIEPLSRVSIVIPVFNESAIVEQSTRELVGPSTRQAGLRGAARRRIGSRDSTPEIVDRLARVPRVRALHSERAQLRQGDQEGVLEAREKSSSARRWTCPTWLPICSALEILRGAATPTWWWAPRRRGLEQRAAPQAPGGHPRLQRPLRVALKFKGTDTHGLKAFRRERLIGGQRLASPEPDVFASELVIGAGSRPEGGRNPDPLHEKREPTINLYKRVPRGWLRNLGTLFVEIRINNRNREG